MYDEIYKIVYSQSFKKKNFHVNLLKILYGIKISLACRKIFRSNGMLKAIEFIDSISYNVHKLPIGELFQTVYQARKIMIFNNIVFKILKKSPNCLETSISLCAYLVFLGYDVKLIIGKAMNYVNPNFDFHSWIELENIVVNDTNQVFELYNKVYEKTFIT